MCCFGLCFTSSYLSDNARSQENFSFETAKEVNRKAFGMFDQQKESIIFIRKDLRISDIAYYTLFYKNIEA